MIIENFFNILSIVFLISKSVLLVISCSAMLLMIYIIIWWVKEGESIDQFKERKKIWKENDDDDNELELTIEFIFYCSFPRSGCNSKQYEEKNGNDDDYHHHNHPAIKQSNFLNREKTWNLREKREKTHHYS